MSDFQSMTWQELLQCWWLRARRPDRHDRGTGFAIPMPSRGWSWWQCGYCEDDTWAENRPCPAHVAEALGPIELRVIDQQEGVE